MAAYGAGLPMVMAAGSRGCRCQWAELFAKLVLLVNESGPQVTTLGEMRYILPCVWKGLTLHLDQKYRLSRGHASVLAPPGKGPWVR